MLLEESIIIKDILIKEYNKKILNICSSDMDFYKNIQPYIWVNLMLPLIKRNNILHNLDLKDGEGIDIVSDCSNMHNIDQNTYDIVLFCSGIEHVKDSEQVLKEIYRILKPDGFAIFSAPGVYPKHDDPIDTMLRLPTINSWKKIINKQWEIIDFKKTIPIPAKSSYKFNKLVFATIIKAILK